MFAQLPLSCVIPQQQTCIPENPAEMITFIAPMSLQTCMYRQKEEKTLCCRSHFLSILQFAPCIVNTSTSPVLSQPHFLNSATYMKMFSFQLQSKHLHVLNVYNKPAAPA